MQTEITEARAGHRATHDPATSTIKNVKIIGTQSDNRRRYAPQVLTAALKLYEGQKVNLNHALDARGKPTQRDYRDRIGTIANVHAQADGLYGDLRYNPKHPIAEQLAWDAENAPHAVGLSHIATVTAHQERDGTTVIESIDAVHSIDLVADPATTRSLYEARDHALTDDDHGQEEENRQQTAAESRLETLEKAIAKIERLLAEESRRDGRQRPQSRDQATPRKRLTTAEWREQIYQ